MENRIENSLNNLLANYQIYYQNLRGFHWNIRGKHFFELHAKFEELYTDVAIKIDEIAERILTIKGIPLHSFIDYIEHSELEPAHDITEGEACVKIIVENLSGIVEQQKLLRKLAEESDDGATGDMMATFIEEQEKTLWMYRAWLN